jgi:hypothetical protein
MRKIKRHFVWVVVIAILVGVVLLFKARKVAAEPLAHWPVLNVPCAESRLTVSAAEQHLLV